MISKSFWPLSSLGCLTLAYSSPPVGSPVHWPGPSPLCLRLFFHLWPCPFSFFRMGGLVRCSLTRLPSVCVWARLFGSAPGTKDRPESVHLPPAGPILPSARPVLVMALAAFSLASENWVKVSMCAPLSLGRTAHMDLWVEFWSPDTSSTFQALPLAGSKPGASHNHPPPSTPILLEWTEHKVLPCCSFLLMFSLL